MATQPATVKSSATLAFSVLGALEASNRNARCDIGGPKQRTVLAVLVVRAGTRVATDILIDEVYGDEVPAGARRSVQTYVSNLRRELGDAITSEPNGYRLVTEPDTIDSHRFAELVANGRDLIPSDPATAAAQLREALGLWRGHPLADLEHRDALRPEVTRLNELRLAAIEARVEADLALGRHHELVAELEALTQEHPYRETLRHHQMIALYRAGRQTEALRAYTRTRQILVDELGIDPSPALQTLEQQILAQDDRLQYSSQPKVVRRSLIAAEMVGDLAASMGPVNERADFALTVEQVIARSIETHNGHVFAQRLNTTFASFTDTEMALECASHIMEDIPTLADARSRPVRIAVDTGDVDTDSSKALTGPVVTRLAGLVALGHAGQVLISSDAQNDAAAAGRWTVRGLGVTPIPHLDRSERTYQLILDHADNDFPPLRTDAAAPALPGGIRSMPGYELRTEVARGPGWSLWLAYQPSVGREVALKIIDPELSNQPDFVRRFEIDALTVARLEHPNVVPLYDYWRDLTGAYLATRWMQGRSLRADLESGKLDHPELDALVEGLGSALGAAHAAGIAHGSVSPDVVFRDSNGVFLLGSFGIAQSGPSGRHAPADANADVRGLLDTIAAAARQGTATSDFLAASAEAETVEDVIALWRTHGGSGSGRSAEVMTASRNPYRGLDSFTQAHASDFYGRNTAVEQLVALLAERRTLAMVGPSGVGKSSVVQAGLLPRLAAGALPGSDDWFVVTMTPGSHPYESFVSSLLRAATTSMPNLDEEVARDHRGLLRSLQRMFPSGAEVLLVIDQFEELFTLTESTDMRDQFISAIAAVAQDPTSNARLVMSIRADFFDHPLSHPTLGGILRQCTVPLAAPTPEELAEMIEGPARGVGVRFEPGLANRIMDDVKDEPGGLPLVEYSLREMFDNRTSNTITFADYEAVGGVLGALGNRAETTLDVTPGSRGLVRQILLRLVKIDEHGTPTRRRALLSELSRLDDATGAVPAIVSRFARHRLLTLDRDPETRSATVEVAHEALFSQWRRLADWIDERKDDLASRQRLLASAAEWEASNRDDEMLLPSGKLTRFEDWVQSTDLALSPIERQLLGRSREVLETAQRRRSRARTLTLATVSVAAVVAIVLALVANTTANRARLLAAESLVGSGQYLLTTGLVEEGAIALVESFDLDGSAAPLSAMGQVINGRGIWATALGDLGGTAAVRPAVDWTSGLVAVAGSTDRFVLLDLESGEQVAVVEVVSPLSALDFLGDGRLIAGHEDGTLTVYSGPEWTNDGPSESLGAKIWDVVTIGESEGIATTAAQGDSRTSRVQRFTITEDSSIKLSTIYPIDSLLGEDIAPRGFSGGIEIVRLMTTHDGDRLVTLGSPTLVAAWDLITGERHAAHAGTGSGAVWSGAASPDGSVIVTGHQNRTLVIRDSDTLEPLGLPTPPVSGQQRSLAFTPSGDRLISSGQGGVLAWQFNPAGEARPPSLGTTPDVISSTSALFTQRSELSPDGTHVVAAVSDRVRMFKVDLGLETHPAAAREEIRDVVSAGNAVWLAGRNGNLIHWDRTTGHSLAMPSEEGLQALAASPAGDSVYTGSRFGSLGVAGPSGWQTQPAHDNQIWAIEWSPDRSVIATASADNTIGLWDPTTLAPVLPRFGPSGEAHQAGLKALAFVDSDRIVTVGGDGYLRVWDAGTGKEMSTNLIVDNQVNAVVPIGEDVVATGDETGTITLFDISAAVTLGELNGHTSAIRGLALSPDGSTLASSGQDNTVRLWDLETNAEVGLLRQSGAVRALAYDAEGDEIIGVDINGGVVVWNANWQDWPRQMCSWLAGWDVQRSWAEVMGTEPYDPACGS